MMKCADFRCGVGATAPDHAGSIRLRTAGEAVVLTPGLDRQVTVPLLEIVGLAVHGVVCTEEVGVGHPPPR